MAAIPELAVWSVRDALRWAEAQLEATSEPRIAARLLLAHLLACSTTDLFIHPERLLTAGQLARYHDLVAQRARHRPVAYLVGHRLFLDLDLAVDERVLIPRPETELLVETVVEAAQRPPFAQRPRPLRIVDVGTGSGAIAIGLAIRLPGAQIAATDVSPGALQVAAENAQRYGVRDRIAFLLGDLLSPLGLSAPLGSSAPLTGMVDIVAANLPYVSKAEYDALPPDIRLFEPREALLAGVDGLDAIRALLDQASSFVVPEGLIALEIGAGQGLAICALAERAFPGAEAAIRQDYAHLDRVVVIRLRSV